MQKLLSISLILIAGALLFGCVSQSSPNANLTNQTIEIQNISENNSTIATPQCTTDLDCKPFQCTNGRCSQYNSTRERCTVASECPGTNSSCSSKGYCVRPYEQKCVSNADCTVTCDRADPYCNPEIICNYYGVCAGPTVPI